jgi:hypothetical protein
MRHQGARVARALSMIRTGPAFAKIMLKIMLKR